MLGIYFSGTGNSRYAVQRFCAECGKGARVLSIEDKDINDAIAQNDEIVFAYPVQFSGVPKYMRDFVSDTRGLWKGKKVFVIATMGLFSGDGAGSLGRLLKRHGAVITGGLHLKMPDSIADEKALKRPLKVNRQLIDDAREKIKRSAALYKEGNPTREGLGFFYHMAGLFGQRLYFYRKTLRYTDKTRVDAEKCVGCGACTLMCPTDNMHIIDGKCVPGSRCTMCYRCVNLCPKQAITVLGKRVVEQGTINKYLPVGEPLE